MDGLWTAEFGSSTGIFGGVVAVFRDGRVLGGDATYYYIGEYTLSGNTLKATLTLSPFIENAESVFQDGGPKPHFRPSGVVDRRGPSNCAGTPQGDARVQLWGKAYQARVMLWTKDDRLRKPRQA